MRIATALTLHTGLLGLVLSLAPAAGARGGEPAAPAPPNILLILFDDLGYTDLGCFGSEISTPNVDALAAQGVRFGNFHTSVAGPPSRAMLLTGTDNHIAGFGNLPGWLKPEQRGAPGYEGYLNDRVMTLAEVLRPAGYHTYMAGVWDLGDTPEHSPHARGFERSFSLLQSGASHFSDMIGLDASAQPVAKYMIDDEVIEALPVGFYSSRSYADFLIERIRESHGDGKPFLAFFAPTAPHEPLQVPEPWLSRYRGRYDAGYEALKADRIAGARRAGLVPESAAPPERDSSVKSWESFTRENERETEQDKQKRRDRVARLIRSMEVYAGMVENLDHHIGRVIDFLREIGEYDNTIIIVASDNGPNPLLAEDNVRYRDCAWLEQFDNSLDNIGRPGSNVAYGPGWASASAGPLNDFKLTVGEGGIRVPLIMTGPGIEGARQVESFAYVTDIMPTLLELAGVEPPASSEGRAVEPMRGRSLTGVLSGDRASAYADDVPVGGEMLGGKWVRRGDDKAVQVAKPYGGGRWQLFDLAADPGETTDLADERPELLEELTAAWDRYAESVGVVPPDRTLDVVVQVSLVVLLAGFLLIIWNYVKGLWGSPRELYMLYVAKLMEYGAYGAINYTFILYLSADCGLSDVKAGTYIGIWSMAMTICSMLIGAVCDAIGIKRTLLLGTAFLLVSRATLPFMNNVYVVTFTSFLPMAIGMGVLLPVLSVGIKYYTTTQGSVLGFALFYTLMNVGWALGAWIFDAVRSTVGEHEIVEVADTGLKFSTYQIIFIAGFLLTVPQFLIYLMFRRGTRMTDDRGIVISKRAPEVDADGARLTVSGAIAKATRDTIAIFAKVITKKPFWIFIFMMAMLVPVRLVFYHFHYTWPKYGIRMFGEGAKVGNMYGVLNPVMIVYLTPLMAVLTKRVRSYTMLTVGTCISVGAVVIAVLPPEWFAPLVDTWFGELVFDRWLNVPVEGRVPLYLSLIIFVAVFTFGESIWSPRLMQFTAEIAPGGKEGTYIALSYLPYFGAKLIVGPMSGWLVATYTPENEACYPKHWMVWVWIGGMAAITPVILITMRKLFRHAEEQDVEAATEHD